MTILLAKIRRWWHCLWGMLNGCCMVTEKRGYLIGKVLFLPIKTDLIACSCGRIFYMRKR